MFSTTTLKGAIAKANQHRRGWAGSSDNRKIFLAAVIVGLLSLAAKIGGMGRELVTAASFGTSDVVDAFVLAWELPAFVINVVAGSFIAAFVPAYVQTRDKEGVEASHDLLAGVLLISLVLLVAMAALLAIIGPFVLPIVASGFGPEKLALTERLLYILLPSVVLSGLATLLTGVLNAGERFALASASALTVPVCTISALLLGRERWGITALAVGLIIGFALQLVILAAGTRRAGVTFRGNWRRQAPVVRRVVGQYVPMVAGMLLVASAGLIDQAMAATLGGGSAAAFSYSGRVVTVILSVGTMALGTAVLPYFSRMVAAADWTAIQRTLRTYSLLILMVTIPATLALVVFSDPLIQLLFERGAFTADDTAVVGRVQAMLALQIPFYSLVVLYVRLISSLKANHLLMYGTIISFTLNISLDYLLKERMGVTGIALATAIVQAVSLAFLGTMLYRLLHNAMRAGE